MNFFFGIKNNQLKSNLTIPRFQNLGDTQDCFLLYEAIIFNNVWKIDEVKCKKNNDFYFIDSDLINNDKIFFLAKKNEIQELEKNKFLKLLNLNNFTDTVPAFRSNLKIFITNGGFSSYQSEYPYSMTIKSGSILSPLNALLDKTADKNNLFIRNIFELPIKKKFNAYFVNIISKKILDKKEIYTNVTNDINIDNDLIHPNIYLFTDNYVGIPMFVSIKNNNISFEHTHPPHQYIFSADKFKKISELKKEINEIINK